MNSKQFGVLLFGIMIGSMTYAHNLPARLQRTPSPEKHASFWDTVKVHAYIDTSYNYLVNNPTFISGDNNRLFDIEPNGFTLQQYSIDLTRFPDNGFGGEVFLLAGRDANQVSPSGWDPDFGSQTLAMYPYKVYLSYRYNRYQIMGGVLDTLVGLESNDSSEDYNFSRSILAYSQPGTRLGVRGAYHYSDATTIYAGIGNGMDTFRNPGQLNLIELSYQYAPSDDVLFAFTYETGNNHVVPESVVNPESRFTLIDVIGKYRLTKQVELAVNADYFYQLKGQQPDGSFATVQRPGVTGYVVYMFNDQWQLAGRADILDDSEGFTSGVRQNWREGTITLQYKPRKNIILRAETRRDISNVNAFFNTSGGTADFQQSFAIEGIYLLA